MTDRNIILEIAEIMMDMDLTDSDKLDMIERTLEEAGY